MCEFRLKYLLGESESEYIEKDYKVLSFSFQNDYYWGFSAKARRSIYQGKADDIDEPEKLWCLPKKKQIGKTGNNEPIYEDVDPPGFLDKMRNKAILDGTLKVQGDDAPPLGDESVPF